MKPTAKNSRRKIAVFLIIGISVIVSWALVMNGPKSGDAFLKLVRGGLDDYRFAFSSGKVYRDVMNGDNATERFIQSYGSQIALKNLNGPEGQTLTLPSQDAFDALLAKEVAAGVDYEPVMEKNIRTVNDSKENSSVYLAELRKTVGLRKTDLWKSLIAFSENGNASQLSAYVRESDSIQKKFLETNVPSSWKSFHIDLINFERKRIEVVRAIAASDEDPVKGLAAMEELEKLNEAELRLAEDFTEKMSEI